MPPTGGLVPAEDKLSIERLLATGPAPPGPALEIVSRIVGQLHKPIGAEALKASRVIVGLDGSVLLGQPMSHATVDGDTVAIGRLFFELVCCSQWSADPADRARQLDDARVTLVLWPSGIEVLDLLEDLLDTRPGYTPRLASVQQRADQLKQKVGGVPLTVWVQQVLGTPEPANPRFAVATDNPDQLTGTWPLGILAAKSGEKTSSGPAKPPEPAFQPPPAAPEPPSQAAQDDIDEMLKALARHPVTPTPRPAPATATPAPSPQRTLAPWFYVATAALVVAGLFFLWLLLG